MDQASLNVVIAVLMIFISNPIRKSSPSREGGAIKGHNVPCAFDCRIKAVNEIDGGIC